VVNKYLMKELVELGVWSPKLKDKIVAANGSVQGIEEIPARVQEIYRTVWEIKQRSLIDMAADRGAFICQSQSLNLFVQEPNFAKLTSMHFHAWKTGLKTGMYYLRTKAAADAIKFTVEKELQVKPAAAPASKEQKMADIACSLENKDDGLACGS
jgi:ribonucleoside-diphosphate reductase alpha chain